MVFGRRRVKKEEPSPNSSASSFLPSPPSTQESRSPRQRVVSEEKEFAPLGSLPALKDKRLFRVPQGRPAPIARRCPSCSGPCTRLITRSSNRNGHSGRPYIKCLDARCNKFVCWDDDVGTYELNPLCGCGKPSRQGMSNADKGRQIYYECVTGQCGFWRAHVDEYGIPVSFNGDIADEMERINLR